MESPIGLDSKRLKHFISVTDVGMEHHVFQYLIFIYVLFFYGGMMLYKRNIFIIPQWGAMRWIVRAGKQAVERELRRS